MSGAGLKHLTVCLLYGGWNNAASSACTKICQGTFGLFLTFIDLKSSNFGDPYWSERSVGVLWWVEVGTFLQLPIGSPLWFYSEIP